VEQETPQVTQEGGVHTMTWEDVPIDVFRHLSIDLGTVQTKEVGKIRDIFNWAKERCEDPTMGNILLRISNMENKLGAPARDEKRWDKMWRFIKLQKQIDDLGKRQHALRRY